jgi:hypothetical protein
LVDLWLCWINHLDQPLGKRQKLVETGLIWVNQLDQPSGKHK